jgi:hypothetical protein
MKNLNFPFQLILLLVLIIATVLSCGRNSKTASTENPAPEALFRLKITLPANVEKLPYLYLSSLADDIQYIKLETGKDLMLGHGQVYYSDKSNYILVVSDNRLRLFDKSGKYIRNIGEPGRGPNEFVPRQVAVDFSNNMIYIFTLGERHILKFDFNGNLKGVIENELFADLSILKYMDSQLILVNTIGPNLKEAFKGGYMELSSLNPASNKINCYLPNNWKIEKNPNMMPFSVSGNEQLSVVDNKTAYYKMQFCDTLYKIANGKIEPFLFIDMGNHKYSVESCQIRMGESVEEHYKNKILIQSMFATNNNLLLQCTYFNADIKQENESFLCVYNQSTNECKYYNSSIINDINGGPNVSVKDLSSPGYLRLAPVLFKDQPDDKTKVYFAVQDNLVLKYPERKDEFKNIINGSSIDDNPIVQFIKMKDDF